MKFTLSISPTAINCIQVSHNWGKSGHFDKKIRTEKEFLDISFVIDVSLWIFCYVYLPNFSVYLLVSIIMFLLI